jgi:hypothetical protein
MLRKLPDDVPITHLRIQMASVFQASREKPLRHGLLRNKAEKVRVLSVPAVMPDNWQRRHEWRSR